MKEHGLMIYVQTKVLKGTQMETRMKEIFTMVRHGKGVYHWVNGEVYDGKWKAGVKDGFCIWRGIFGYSYMGQWVECKAYGDGVH